MQRFFRWTGPIAEWVRSHPALVGAGLVVLIAGGGTVWWLARRWAAVMVDWVAGHPTLVAWAFGLSLFLFVGSLLVIPLMIARLRADYFVSDSPGEESWFGRHPVARFLTLAVKNGLGAVLLAAGIAMLVLPGQGIVTILVALTLLNFPGKRKLELLIVRQRHVRRAIRWIRERARRPPLILPDRRGTEGG